MGSPPPTRGLQEQYYLRMPRDRITPAHAGTTINLIFLLFLSGDHPRPRGDYHKGTPYAVEQLGSPPPTRGLPPLIAPQRILTGITPAHAGTTNAD